MSRPSNREQLIETGVETLMCRGFSNASVRDIASAAGVPLGSFTNHFRSKEDYAVEVLDRYFASIQHVMAQTLESPNMAPLQRLDAYLDVITDLMSVSGWRYGCLIGNLGLEVSGYSELIRTRLQGIFADWLRPFLAVVVDAQRSGELRDDLSPEEVAEFLLAGWHGAILRMKVERSDEPLKRFRRIIEVTLFQSGRRQDKEPV
ncbi:MAG: TetR family transcriptional regulator C-terminal domain-containing protein [Phenylobacterium sp.]|jgi:TetR/AcrR family transcriptional repressor of nem operon|nr:TetR family transcriptional regulator C-terminal domain-containing protein [Phenylobacterium sp.]MCA3731411.1 TetR family transcriptional regulator C-terminal domain-containing protein [Phenylobacterium sp.]MCA3738536.1 TetR family transcriptional regulator C-terminal domain-containing protein [Phenylobacterium sp.]MCA4916193.1 TetR family transcriptional regulator C-terminal domain-containing protein [Phenylobacterium sp.]MCA6246256.1 TetR family transcriptional regulator C-terminal domain-